MVAVLLAGDTHTLLACAVCKGMGLTANGELTSLHGLCASVSLSLSKYELRDKGQLFLESTWGVDVCDSSIPAVPVSSQSWAQTQQRPRTRAQEAEGAPSMEPGGEGRGHGVVLGMVCVQPGQSRYDSFSLLQHRLCKTVLYK